MSILLSRNGSVELKVHLAPYVPHFEGGRDYSIGYPRSTKEWLSRFPSRSLPTTRTPPQPSNLRRHVSTPMFPCKAIFAWIFSRYVIYMHTPPFMLTSTHGNRRSGRQSTRCRPFWCRCKVFLVVCACPPDRDLQGG